MSIEAPDRSFSRPAGHPANRSGTNGSQPAARSDRSGVVVTVAIAVGLVLTTLPLRSVFTDWTWLVTTIACAAPYWLVVSFFRTRSTPLWWHSVLGLAGSGLVIAWIFVPQNLALGIIPTPTSITDVNSLVTQARRSLQVEHAPIASTTSLRFMTSGLLTLLAALTDILGVGLRRPLLAGAPLLEILAVASTTSSKATSPLWFVAAAAGFLLIVLAGTRLQDEAWGPAVDGSMGGRLGGARSIAVVAVGAALLVPVVLPGRSGNVIAKATHHSGAGDGSGQTVLNNLASLRGSLKRGTPTDLFKVTVSGAAKPFYIRQAVLDTFNDTGWLPSATAQQGLLSPLATSNFSVLPSTSGGTGFQSAKAEFTTLGLGGQNLPILANPVSLTDRLRGQWDAQTATVAGADLKRNLKYTETIQQADPTTTQLLNAGVTDDPALDRDLTLPPQSPIVVGLARRLTADKATPYEKALAISNYFTDGENGFGYSLNAPPDDGRQAIVTFLDKKQGYCQQYAAAAAVLMREAGLPTRVVIGYTHTAPDVNGSFTVSTLDAHAWVETYFEGIGWTPFDPTPLAGADLARTVPLPYALHGADGVPSATTTGPSAAVSAQATAPKAAPRVNEDNAGATDSSVTHKTGTSVIWIVVGVVAFLLAALLTGPRILRRQLRRRRMAQAHKAGTAEPLWHELAASAFDQGSLWPDTLTVAQVPGWLGGHGLDERGRLAVTAVADRLERDRFAAPVSATAAAMADGDDAGGQRARGPWPGDEIAGFDAALSRWGRRTEPRQTLVFGWLPRSLFTRRDSIRR